MDIKELRVQIDGIDDGIVGLFCERMLVSGGIAQFKAENGLPVLDEERERQKLADVLSKAAPELREYVSALYSLIFELSRSYQDKCLKEPGAASGE